MEEISQKEKKDDCYNPVCEKKDLGSLYGRLQQRKKRYFAF